MKETGVRINATLILSFEAYGKIEQLLRAGDELAGNMIAIELVNDVLACNDTSQMLIDGVSVSLNERKLCKWLHDEVCCNAESDECADFPSQEVCNRCKYFEV